MSSPRRINVSSKYFSHPSSSVARKCCHRGDRCPRERKQKYFSSLCLYHYMTKQTGSLQWKRNCKVLQQRASMQGWVKKWTIKAIELPQGQTALLFFSSNSILTVLGCDHSCRVVGLQEGLLPCNVSFLWEFGKSSKLLQVIVLSQ